MLLENVSQTCMFDEHLPTMVSFPSLSFDDPTTEDEEEEEEEQDAPSQLDKAVERMRQLAAAKCT